MTAAREEQIRDLSSRTDAHFVGDVLREAELETIGLKASLAHVPEITRAQAFEQAAQVAEVFLHKLTTQEEHEATLAAYSNGTVRRIAAAIRAKAKEGT